MEDDEPSTEEEDEDDRDRAFVAGYGTEGRRVGVDQSNEGRGTDDGSSSDSSSDSEDDNDLQPPPSHQLDRQSPSALAVLPDDLHVPASSTFDESSISRLSIAQEQAPSFDVSPNTSLPEGFTISGNQSGMTTGMVVADSTSTITNRPSDVAPVDPYDRKMLQTYLSQLPTPIQLHSNVVDLSARAADKVAGLQKTAKKRANSKTKDRTGTFDDAWDLELDGEVFSVREKMGEGAFGAVYRIALPVGDDEEEEDFDVDGNELFLAVKVEKPTNFWEFYVLDQMQTRFSERPMNSILTPHRLYAYSDESFLLLDLCDRGSLLNAVNKAQEYRIAPPGNGTTGLDELLAIFFVIELLRTLEGFHSAGFIHGDLKIDNCLLRFEDLPEEVVWQTVYDSTGANGWSEKGLKVIDYGRTIDTTMFKPGQQFDSDLKTDKYDCIEMQSGKPWTFEPDYHGVASIAYCALFGHYMETESVQVQVQVEGGETTREKRVPKQAFRRYHQTELWTKLFDMLLNPRQVRPDGSLPVTSELAAVRIEMEEWLALNCNKNGKSLKSLLSKL
jgi:checkpoint serine/threonine-protein kinase